MTTLKAGFLVILFLSACAFTLADGAVRLDNGVSNQDSGNLRDIADDCIKSFIQFATDVISKNMNKTEQFWLSNSGKTLNDMGHSHTCNKYNNDSTYSVIKTNKKDLLFKFSYGYCGELECTPEVLNTALARSIPQDNLLVILSAVANGTGYPPQDYSFTFATDSNNTFGASGTLMIVIMLLITVPTILSCCFYLFILKSKKKHTDAKDILDNTPAVWENRYKVKGIFDIFSYKKNTEFLMDYGVNPNKPYLRTLDGLKFFAMLGTVYYSENYYRFGFSKNFGNKDDWSKFLGGEYMQGLMPGYLIHDIFFFIGGTVATLTIMDIFSTRKDNTSWESAFRQACVRKIFRFWPLYTIMTLFYWLVLPGFTNGPNGHLIEEYTSQCKDHFWADLLTIGAYLYPNSSCIDFSWYLQIDFHYFVVLALVLYVCYKMALGDFFMYILLGALTTISYIFSWWNFHHYNLVLEAPSGSALEWLQYRKYWFRNPLTRASSYFLGAMFGVYFYTMYVTRARFEENNADIDTQTITNSAKDGQSRFKSQELNPDGMTYGRKFNFLYAYLYPIIGIAIAAVAGITLTMYLHKGGNSSTWTNYQNLVNIIVRPLICATVALLCVPEITRVKGSFFGWVLTAEIWIQFSRAALAFFLVYICYLHNGIGAELNSQFYDEFLMTNYVFGDFYISLIFCFIMSLFFEVPFRRLGYLLAKLV